MKHTSLDQICEVARVHAEPSPLLSRSERLERWAKSLDLYEKPVATLDGTEYQTDETRSGMRRSGTALSVAFADPVLRAAGLEGDTYGQAKGFFSLSNSQLHYIICGCHSGSHMTSNDAARRVRATAWTPNTARFILRMRNFLGRR